MIADRAEIIPTNGKYFILKVKCKLQKSLVHLSITCPQAFSTLLTSRQFLLK